MTPLAAWRCSASAMIGLISTRRQPWDKPIMNLFIQEELSKLVCNWRVFSCGDRTEQVCNDSDGTRNASPKKETPAADALRVPSESLQTCSAPLPAVILSCASPVLKTFACPKKSLVANLLSTLLALVLDHRVPPLLQLVPHLIQLPLKQLLTARILVSLRPRNFLGIYANYRLYSVTGS